MTFDGTLNVGDVQAVIEVARPQGRSEVVIAADDGLFQMVVDSEDGRWCLVYFNIFVHEHKYTSCVVPFLCIFFIPNISLRYKTSQGSIRFLTTRTYVSCINSLLCTLCFTCSLPSSNVLIF